MILQEQREKKKSTHFPPPHPFPLTPPALVPRLCFHLSLLYLSLCSFSLSTPVDPIMEISICDGALKSRLARGKAFYCDFAIPLGDQRVEFAHNLEGGPYVCLVWFGRDVECFFKGMGHGCRTGHPVERVLLYQYSRSEHK